MSRSLSVAKFLVALLTIAYIIPCYCLPENYAHSYWLLDHPEGSTRYSLTVSVTPFLYEHYSSSSHSVAFREFAKFVTPNALEPVAEDLWEIYNDEEDFANGVLMILHQIPYEESDPKYPVETIVENHGDCDTFSYLGASIMKAGGLGVVLLYYENQSHMNLGVHLSQPPQDSRFDAHYFSYQGKKYYMAECTGENWETGWRVGECPKDFQGASAGVISLEDCEQQSPGQVSSSYNPLASSSISLALSSMYAMPGSIVTISGSIFPQLSYRNITVYARLGSSWSAIRTLVTDINGSYSYEWEPNSAGVYYVRASWSGDSEYAGADSSVCRLIAIPAYWLIAATVAICLVGIGVVAVLLNRQAEPMEEV